MSTESYSSDSSPRLNPFIFPSDTDFRFALLIVSVIGVSLIIYQMLYNTVPGVLERSLATQVRCMESAEAAHPNDPFAQSDAFEGCMLPADRVRALGIFGAVVFLLVVAGLIYWYMPTWKIRRSQLVPLSAEDAPDVVAYLADLCGEVGLAQPPIFLWNPLNPNPNGVAFGRWGRYYVSMTGGLVGQFYTDRAAFRAVMLHELSHLLNGDVNQTYLAVAIWWAFVAVALVPFVIGQPYAISRLGKPWGNLFGQGWRLLGLTALVYLTRNAVLRAREMYADVRASVWDGPEGALRRVLKTLVHPAGGRWRSVVSVHPDPDDRERTLDDTDRLFRLGFWDAFGTGVAAMIAYSGFQFWLGLITKPSLVLDILEALGAALIFAPLVVGVVGSGVWRTTFASMARGKLLRGLGRLGLGVGLGAILGQILNIVAYALRASADLDFIGWISLVGIQAFWNSLLLISLVLLVHWVAVGASTWLEVAVNSQTPRPTYRL
ncbi:MAG: M48 family metalloprotease, partial [Anaerolineales bacterium]|nr:M48 family metalloprotease [Anaerolineales bacterium]